MEKDLAGQKRHIISEAGSRRKPDPRRSLGQAAEAAAALAGLGYNRQEAVAAVAAVRGLGDTAEELVALALKRIGK